MKKQILILFVCIFMFSLVSAAECGDNNLGTFKQTETMELRQTCDDCSYVNLSSVAYPNGTTINFDLFMTKTGRTFNYTFSPSVNGDYFYSVYGDKDGGLESETFCFEVTPSGQGGVENIIFILVVLILLYTLTLIFFLKRDIELAPFTALSGMALGAFGLYMIRNGVIIYRDWFSNYLSYVTMGVGFGLGLWSLIEWISDQM